MAVGKTCDSCDVSWEREDPADNHTRLWAQPALIVKVGGVRGEGDGGEMEEKWRRNAEWCNQFTHGLSVSSKLFQTFSAAIGLETGAMDECLVALTNRLSTQTLE